MRRQTPSNRKSCCILSTTQETTTLHIPFRALMATFTMSSMLSAQVRGVAAENIDHSVNACTDFDAYANGQWRATHPMPAIQTTWAVRTVTQDETYARLRSIAEEDSAKS